MSRWRSRFVRTERLTLHLREQGDPHGPPVLLLHGSFATGRWWAPAMELLPDSLYIVAPDLRGCGLSDKPGFGYEIESLAGDVHQLVEALGMQDVDLVGHSAGGAIAVEFALQHMKMLHTLTLVDSVPIEGVYSPPELMDLLAQMRPNAPDAAHPADERSGGGGRLPRQDARDLIARSFALLMPSLAENAQAPAGLLAGLPRRDFFDMLVDDATTMDPAAFTEIARALNTWNRLGMAGRLTLPTLLLWGDLDSVVDKEATTRTLLAIPGAEQLEVLRGVGHSPMIEAPLTFAERLIDFITASS